MANMKTVSNLNIDINLRDSMDALSKLSTATKIKRLRLKLRINKAKAEGAPEVEIQRMEIVQGLYEKHIASLDAQYFVKKDELEKHLGKFSYKTQRVAGKALDAVSAVPAKVKGWFSKKPEQDARELLKSTDRVVTT